MKKVVALLCTIFIIALSHFLFEYFKTEKVLLVGELIGFEISNKESVQNNGVIPVSHNALGTMSFIKKDTNEFVALGHSAVDEENEYTINSNCFSVKPSFVEKNTDNSIGAVVGSINKKNQIGVINKDTNYGIYGVLNNINPNNYIEMETASRYRVKKR